MSDDANGQCQKCDRPAVHQVTFRVRTCNLHYPDLSAPFTSPTFWICPVCGSGAAERVESCEGYVDIADHEEGETEDVDARHEIVYRPEYVQRLLAAVPVRSDHE